jgi:hypothetical protein
MGGEGKIVEADETYIGKVPEDKVPTKKADGTPFQSTRASLARRNKRVVVALESDPFILKHILRS